MFVFPNQSSAAENPQEDVYDITVRFVRNIKLNSLS